MVQPVDSGCAAMAEFYTFSRMTAHKVAALAALGAAAAWALKGVAIAVAGGLDQSPLEGPLYFLGLILMLIAYGAAGWAVTATRSTGLRLLGILGGLIVGSLVGVAIQAVVGVVVPDAAGWVREEAGLWVASVLTAAVMLGWWRSTTSRVRRPHR
jgi:hypothetical protein